MRSKCNIDIFEGRFTEFCGLQYPYSTFLIPNSHETIG